MLFRSLFVDAAVGLQSAYDFRAVSPSEIAPMSTHGLEPEQLLAVYWQWLGLPAPAAYVLEISGTDFELGRPLSAMADANLRLALGFVVRLLGHVHQVDEYVLQRGSDGRNRFHLDAAAGEVST